ncbi:MAG TPA: PilZ domain-containing protein [Candidatus Methylomirabilis sp.]|nr:PilZ domain-containing protein [Candidatus Methylomirabilis sp.]
MAQSQGKSGAAKPRRGRPTTGPRDRRHSRFSMNLPVRVTRVAGGRARAWPGRTANLSGGGLAVELPTHLPPGTRVAIEVRTAIGPLRMEADVLWTQRVPGGARLTRHGLCLADHSEVMDLPIHALLGQWLVGLAKREEAGKAKRRAPRPTRRPRASRR